MPQYADMLVLKKKLVMIVIMIPWRCVGVPGIVRGMLHEVRQRRRVVISQHWIAIPAKLDCHTCKIIGLPYLQNFHRNYHHHDSEQPLLHICRTAFAIAFKDLENEST